MAVEHVYLPKDLPKALERQGNALRAAVLKGLRMGAQRGMGVIADRIAHAKPFAPVNTGQYRRSWRVERTPTGATLGSDAPYSPIIELGRRPGAAGPPIGPIREWVYRKFRVSKGWKAKPRNPDKAHAQANEIESMAWAIRNAIHKHGTKPRLIMSGAQGKLAAIAEEEIRKAIEEAAREAR